MVTSSRFRATLILLIISKRSIIKKASIVKIAKKQSQNQKHIT
jgi:hypothetical protein